MNAGDPELPGWLVLQRTTNTGRSYKVFHGPNGEYAESKRQAMLLASGQPLTAAQLAFKSKPAPRGGGCGSAASHASAQASVAGAAWAAAGGARAAALGARSLDRKLLDSPRHVEPSRDRHLLRARHLEHFGHLLLSLRERRLDGRERKPCRDGLRLRPLLVELLLK